MTLSKTRRASLVAILAVGLLSTQLSAATERRRVASAPTTDVFVAVTGTVLDSATGAAVFQAQVVNETRTVTANAQGQFTIQVPINRQTTITVSRWGYNASTQTVRLTAATALEFRLSPKPTITLRKTDGTTHQLDFELAQFAYLIPFSGYAKFDAANFCKSDGTEWHPAKSEFRRIIGPTASSTFTPCCTLGPIMSAQVEMKSGETTTAYFADSCFGNEIDFLGRDRSNGQFVYYNFAKIAEITFP